MQAIGKLEVSQLVNMWHKDLHQLILKPREERQAERDEEKYCLASILSRKQVVQKVVRMEDMSDEERRRYANQQRIVELRNNRRNDQDNKATKLGLFPIDGTEDQLNNMFSFFRKRFLGSYYSSDGAGAGPETCTNGWAREEYINCDPQFNQPRLTPWDTLVDTMRMRAVCDGMAVDAFAGLNCNWFKSIISNCAMSAAQRINHNNSQVRSTHRELVPGIVDEFLNEFPYVPHYIVRLVFRHVWSTARARIVETTQLIRGVGEHRGRTARSKAGDKSDPNPNPKPDPDFDLDEEELEAQCRQGLKKMRFRILRFESRVMSNDECNEVYKRAMETKTRVESFPDVRRWFTPRQIWAVFNTRAKLFRIINHTASMCVSATWHRFLRRHKTKKVPQNTRSNMGGQLEVVNKTAVVNVAVVMLPSSFEGESPFLTDTPYPTIDIQILGRLINKSMYKFMESLVEAVNRDEITIQDMKLGMVMYHIATVFRGGPPSVQINMGHPLSAVNGMWCHAQGAVRFTGGVKSMKMAASLWRIFQAIMLKMGVGLRLDLQREPGDRADCVDRRGRLTEEGKRRMAQRIQKKWARDRVSVPVEPLRKALRKQKKQLQLQLQQERGLKRKRGSGSGSGSGSSSRRRLGESGSSVRSASHPATSCGNGAGGDGDSDGDDADLRNANVAEMVMNPKTLDVLEKVGKQSGKNRSLNTVAIPVRSRKRLSYPHMVRYMPMCSFIDLERLSSWIRKSVAIDMYRRVLEKKGRDARRRAGEAVGEEADFNIEELYAQYSRNAKQDPTVDGSIATAKQKTMARNMSRIVVDCCNTQDFNGFMSTRFLMYPEDNVPEGKENFDFTVIFTCFGRVIVPGKLTTKEVYTIMTRMQVMFRRFMVDPEPLNAPPEWDDIVTSQNIADVLTKHHIEERVPFMDTKEGRTIIKLVDAYYPTMDIPDQLLLRAYKDDPHPPLCVLAARKRLETKTAASAKTSATISPRDIDMHIGGVSDQEQEEGVWAM